jgi:hypothetical protein
LGVFLGRHYTFGQVHELRFGQFALAGHLGNEGIADFFCAMAQLGVQNYFSFKPEF